MNQTRVGWNDHLLRQLFSNEDVRAIMNTPCSLLGRADRLVCMHSNDGQYTTKSGYKVAKSCQKRSKGDEGTSSRNEEAEKNKVWSLDIKKKIQFFIWRACHDRLPVEVNLKKRGMHVDGVCRQCGEGMETLDHLLFHCPKAKRVWKLAHVTYKGLDQFSYSFREWWTKLGNDGEGPEMRDRQELT